jgi:hypothetical protein
MKLSLIKPRIAQISNFSDVKGAADLASVMKQGQWTSVAYAVPTGRSAESSPVMTGVVSQRLTEKFCVAFWARDVSDPTGDAALDAVDTITQLLVAKLQGWSPASGYAPLEYVSGKLLMFSATAGALWADEFKTTSVTRQPTSE